MLNEIEKDALQILLGNELLLSTIYKILNLTIEENRPAVNAEDNNSLIGEKYRAYETSKQILNSGFRQLNAYKKGRESTAKLNRAR